MSDVTAEPLVLHLTAEAFDAGVMQAGKRLLSYEDIAAMTGRKVQTFSAARTPSRRRRGLRVRMPEPVVVAVVTSPSGRAERPLFDPDAIVAYARQVDMIDEHGRPANLRFGKAALARPPRPR